MKRIIAKKGIEKRKKARRMHSSGRMALAAKQRKGNCYSCTKNLAGDQNALFVEEEVGRIFCSEGCIASFFSSDIQRLEKEYFRKLSPNDLSGEDREKFSHLRWITLQEPDEVWREKTLSGDFRFTMISEFRPDHKRVWCICICLFLRGEPSFLYLAFPTRNAAMANAYRKGERVQRIKSESKDLLPRKKNRKETSEKPAGPVDRLADAWTEDETLRAQLTQERRGDDIPAEEYNLYQHFLEQTLEEPDEVWSLMLKDENPFRLYHFLKYYSEEKIGVWYVVVARETDDEDQIEILDAFPTRDSNLIDRYRQGEQEVGALSSRAKVGRVVH